MMGPENRYKEILKLRDMLEEAHRDLIGYQILFYDGQILFYDGGKMICSVVENMYSYGNESDLLEIMGLLTEEESEMDSVVGWLTAENVFNRIQNYISQKA